jgi:hypothetical protein
MTSGLELVQDKEFSKRTQGESSLHDYHLSSNLLYGINLITDIHLKVLQVCELVSSDLSYAKTYIPGTPKLHFIYIVTPLVLKCKNY